MPDFLRVNGRLMHHAFRPGTGPRAVVFANSLGTDRRIWDGVLRGMPLDVPVLSYDKSGHGLSEDGAVTIQGFADDLAALMDALGIGEAMVRGVSVGGMIAQALASSRRDLVSGLVLCNTGARIGTPDTWDERIRAAEEAGLDTMADGILERWFSPRFRERMPQEVAGYRMMLTRTPVRGYVTVCKAIRGSDLTDRTSGITCPTLCIAGGDDLATPPDVVHALAAIIPGARTVCYESRGHVPCIEKPDRLVEDILEHLGQLA